jgi:hypothetical protein
MKLFRNNNYGLKHFLASNFPIDKARISYQTRKKLTSNNVDDQIKSILSKSEALTIGRLGGSEARYLGALYQKRYSKSYGSIFRPLSWYNLKKRRSEISSGAGFYFKSQSDENRFLDIYLDCLANVDVLGIWGTAFAWIEHLGTQNVKFNIPVGATAPWVEEYPYLELESSETNFGWSEILNSKKILIISPFTKSIQMQYLRINEIFSGKNFPKFTIEYITSPMTFNGENSNGLTWFENLDLMKEKMNDKEFDIALIGAGGYSFPLATYAKKIGKIGIHTGGGLQLFFGILGNRWMNSEYVLKYYNESWVYPFSSETPINSKQVENSSYWKPSDGNER